jgi:catechol 2,3-dioxygenase-like lactoylglutathione lyase family enzyme
MTNDAKKSYVEPTQQLILELYVSDIQSSIQFFTSLGFHVAVEEHNFVVVQFELSQIYMEQVAGHHPPGRLIANVRVMVEDVDAEYDKVKKLGYKMHHDIENRFYGLRDFTIEGPDGVGIRFGTYIKDLKG